MFQSGHSQTKVAGLAQLVIQQSLNRRIELDVGIKLRLYDRVMVTGCCLCFISNHPALFLKCGNGQHTAVHASQLVTGFKQ